MSPRELGTLLAGAALLLAARGAQVRELRREAAELKANPRPPALVPAGIELPRELVDAGGHDASGEGR